MTISRAEVITSDPCGRHIRTGKDSVPAGSNLARIAHHHPSGKAECQTRPAVAATISSKQ